MRLFATLGLAVALPCSLLAPDSQSQTRAVRDEFFWLDEINKTTAVINTDEGLLDRSMTRLVHSIPKNKMAPPR